jgi:hypothetical protein
LERELQLGIEKTVCCCVMVEESPKNGNRSPNASQSDTQFNTKKFHLEVEKGRESSSQDGVSELGRNN